MLFLQIYVNISGLLNTYFLLGLFVLFGLNSAAQKSDRIKKYSPDEIRKDATVYKDAILAMHPVIGYYQPREFYDSLYQNFISSIHDSLTEKALRLKLKLLTNELHCGHSEVMYSKETMVQLSKLRHNFSPYLFLPMKDKLYLLGAMLDKPDTSFHKGCEILRINGHKVDSLINFIRPLITTDGYSQTAKDHYIQLGFNTYFPSLIGKPDSFVVRYRDGFIEKEIRYAAKKYKNLPQLPLRVKQDSLFKHVRRSSIYWRYADESKQTILMRIDAFSHSAYRRAYRKIFKDASRKKVKNIVIDLRNNGGGSLGNTYTLLAYLVDSLNTQTLKTRVKNYPLNQYTKGNRWFRFTRFVFSKIGTKVTRGDTDIYVYRIVPTKKWKFRGKVFVMTNGGTFSAAALTAAYLKKRQEVLIIGEETGGAAEGCNAGISAYYTLPNSRLRVVVPAFRIVHDVSPEKTGAGVQPDVPIVYTFKDLQLRRDLEWEYLKQLLKIE